VAQINGKFGSLDYTPVLHYHKRMEDDYFLSLLSAADVGLITSVRDGVNSTTYEFVFCQKDNHGPLILSEFTGTATSLSGAMLVNPWDYTVKSFYFLR
jgi:trehalose 6-phosphate synthase/phosphatase